MSAPIEASGPAPAKVAELVEFEGERSCESDEMLPDALASAMLAVVTAAEGRGVPIQEVSVSVHPPLRGTGWRVMVWGKSDGPR